jgi:hypothetical protein
MNPVARFLTAWLFALATGLAVSWSAAGEADLFDAEGYAAAAQEPADAVARSELADALQCRELYGPNAVAFSLPNGEHRCTDKHGRRLTPRSVVLRASLPTPTEDQP